MDNGALYYKFEYTKKFCTGIKFLYIIWPTHLLDLNFIKKFCHIIKIQVSSCHYQIILVKEIKIVLSEE